MREGELVAHEHDLVRSLQQSGHDLPRDFRSLPLVGGCKRLVEQDQRVWREDVDHVVHAAEFLIELAALHRRVLFALEMREYPVDDVQLKARGRREHARLRHHLREPEAPEERRLAALIGARDMIRLLPSALTSLPTGRLFTLSAKPTS